METKPMPEPAAEPIGSDAFISYSRRDKAFAALIEKALKAYTAPAALGLAQRHLQVFRDESDMTGVDYYRAIDAHLTGSRKLIVLCSPQARDSSYVNDEVRRFVNARGAGHVVPVLLSGLPNNEARPGQEAQMAFPAALTDALEMPLAVSYLDFDPRRNRVDRDAYYGSWCTLLANLHDKSRSEIEQRETRRRARRRWLAGSVTGAVVLALSAALVTAVLSRNQAATERDAANVARATAQTAQQGESRQRKEAEHQQQLAEERRVVADEQRRLAEERRAEAERERAVAEERRTLAVSRQLMVESRANLGEQYDLALLLAGEAARIHPSVEARHELQQALNNNVELRQVLHGHAAQIVAIAGDGAGAHFASADRSGRVLVWGADGGTPMRTIETGAEVSAIAFHPTRPLIAVATGDQLRFWDSARGTPLGTTFEAHKKSITALAFSPDGRSLATASWDNTVGLWNLGTEGSAPERRAQLEGHGSGHDLLATGVQAVAFSPDSTLLASAGGDGTVIVWNTADARSVGPAFGASETRSGQLFPGLSAVAFSPDGKVLAVGGHDNEIQLWAMPERKPIGAPLRGHRSSIDSLAFGAGGAVLFSSAGDGTVRAWSTGDGRSLAEFRGHAWGAVHLLAQVDGTIVSGADDARLVVWQPLVRGDRMVRTWQHPAPDAQPVVSPQARRRLFPDLLRAVASDPSGRLLASGSDDGSVVIREAASGREVDRFRAFEAAPVFALAISPDLRWVAAGGLDDGVVLRPIGRNETRRLPGHGRAVGALAFSADGALLAAGAADGRTAVWDVARADLVGRLSGGHASPITLVGFGPQPRQLLTGDTGGKLVLWDSRSGAIVHSGRPFAAPGEVQFAVAQGTRWVAAGDGQDVKLWDVQRWRGQALAIPAQRAPFGPMSVTPDGSLVAVSERASETLASTTHVSVWNSRTQAEVAGPLNARVSINRLTFIGEGRALAEVGASADVLVWDLAPGAMQAVACRVAGRNLTSDEQRRYLPDDGACRYCPGLPGSDAPVCRPR